MNLPMLLAQPLGLVALRGWTKLFGSARQQERLDVLRRPHFAYGLFRAAEAARFFDLPAVTVCEFGVASGAGLLNMVALSRLVTAETGIKFRIVGFDTGHGLPKVEGHRDHAELWAPGDFPMEARDRFIATLKGEAEMVFGDIDATIPSFVKTLDPRAPLGFIAIDVDTYSSTKAVLKCFVGEPARYSPLVGIYCDDIEFVFANKWCGELRAIEEFNQEHDLRKIDGDRSLPGTRPVRNAGWHQHMFFCHILDHERRNESGATGRTLAEHYRMVEQSFLY